jgi:hypothetical protein
MVVFPFLFSVAVFYVCFFGVVSGCGGSAFLYMLTYGRVANHTCQIEEPTFLPPSYATQA